jgi:transcriptional regulator with XRE-family HTH domain
MKGKRRDPSVMLKRLAKTIRGRREERGLSQEDVAGEAAISVRHYQKVESGSVDVRYTSLVGIANALETTIGELAN